MAAGFERASTTDKKFKSLADRLGELGVSSLRLDTAGIGLSDGDYGELSVDAMAASISSAAAWLRERGYPTVSAAGHSLGACAVAASWNQVEWNRAALLAPAFNQAALLRYAYVQKERPDEAVTWDNFSRLLDEGRFQVMVSQGMTTRHNRIASGYFEENMDRDYSRLLLPYGDLVMHVHGDGDDKVPLASADFRVAERIVVAGGDHDLDGPIQLEQWLSRAASWLMI
jgi:alpha/beta superfamily hydrolase